MDFVDPTLTRRQWLTLTAAALAPSSGWAAPGDPSGGCRMGYGSYGLPGYSLPEAVRVVAETGYDAIEIVAIPGYHGDPEKVSPELRKEVRTLAADRGIHLSALMGLPRPAGDREGRAKSLDRLKRLLELARDLVPDSPPLIQGVLGGGEWEERKNVFRDALGEWLEPAAAAGVHLSIKPHRGHAMSRPEHAAWLIEQLGATGKLSLVYDYSHYVHRDMTAEETVVTALPRTGYLVMKDAVKQPDGKVRFQLPGASGEMPHAGILKQFHAGGYRGEVCCEVSSQVWRAKGFDPGAAAKTCYANLAAIFSEAGVSRPSR